MIELSSLMTVLIGVSTWVLAMWVLYRWLKKPADPKSRTEWNPERFEQLQVEERRRIHRRKKTQ